MASFFPITHGAEENGTHKHIGLVVLAFFDFIWVDVGPTLGICISHYSTVLKILNS